MFLFCHMRCTPPFCLSCCLADPQQIGKPSMCNLTAQMVPTTDALFEDLVLPLVLFAFVVGAGQINPAREG